MQARGFRKRDSRPRLSLFTDYLDKGDDLARHNSMEVMGKRAQSFTGNSAGFMPGRAKHSVIVPSFRLFERIYEAIMSKKALMTLFVAVSLVFHLMLVESIYLVSQRQEVKVKSQEAKKATFKIMEPEELPMPKNISTPKAKPQEQTKKAVSRSGGVEKERVKLLPAKKLEALGKQHISLMREGSFPTLILSYNNPTSYIKQMYALGAKSVIYDKARKECYEIDLFSGDIFPLSKYDLAGFSAFKRVIRDAQWDPHKMRAASFLNRKPDVLEILLVVPVSIETRWVGHQVNIFNQLDIQVSQIDTVEAQFNNSKLKLVRIHLKDGSTRRVNDPGCA